MARSIPNGPRSFAVRARLTARYPLGFQKCQVWNFSLCSEIPNLTGPGAHSSLTGVASGGDPSTKFRLLASLRDSGLTLRTPTAKNSGGVSEHTCIQSEPKFIRGQKGQLWFEVEIRQVNEQATPQAHGTVIPRLTSDPANEFFG